MLTLLRYFYIWVKPILIAASLASGAIPIIIRILDLGLSLSLVAYLVLALYLYASIISTAFIKKSALRWFYAVLFSISNALVVSFERITGDQLSYDSYLNMANSVGFADEALSQHHGNILIATALSLLLLIGIGLKPKWDIGKPALFYSTSPILSVFLLSCMLFVRGGYGAKALPAPYQLLAYSSLHAYELANSNGYSRNPVTIQRHSEWLQRHVVLIVDESISANYLDVANPRGIETCLTKRHSHINIFNYGYAASITNCSSGTNVTLRYGGTRDAYRRINATEPSIWDYAKDAGIHTVYIDAQRTGGSLQNLMNAEELESINEFIQFDGLSVRDRDMAVADKLAELLKGKHPTFIYVNKIGAHFPINDKYPDDFMLFKPALPRSKSEIVSDTGTDVKGGNDTWRLYRNSYRNTLLWNVNAFFKRLLTKADLSGTTLIYTSDHGQDLHEHGNPGNTAHCNSNPMIEEGVVPLIIIEGKGMRETDWKKNAEVNHNRISHYNIFPTLLELMGYEAEMVRKMYGNPISERIDEPLTFNIRFNARFGISPEFRQIDIEKIAAPPNDDNLPL